MKGYPSRPLCDVSDSYGHTFSYFISNILKEVRDDELTMCDSTEDMLAPIRHASNTNVVKSNSVVGSIDVKALYPSLELDFAIDILCIEFYKSGITIQVVDHQELGLYLNLGRSEQYLTTMGIPKRCPSRKIPTLFKCVGLLSFH